MQGSATKKQERGLKRAETLLAWARDRVRARPAEFIHAGKYLDDLYGLEAVLERRRCFLEKPESPVQLASACQIGIGEEDSAGLQLQARLSAALVDLTASPPDMTAMAAEDPLVPARVAVLVACLVTDRDAAEYCSGLTGLASLEWLRDDMIGRGMIPPLAEDLGGWAFVPVLAGARAALESAGARRPADACCPDLTPAEQAPCLEELTRALIASECAAASLRHTYEESRAIYATHGEPRREHHPEWRASREAANAAAVARETRSLRAAGEEAPDCVFVAPHRWERNLEDYVDAYRRFVADTSGAIRLAGAAAIKGLRTEPKLPEHFLLELLTTLRTLLGAWHPTEVGGRGLGMIRAACPEVPDAFVDAATSVTRSRVTLQAVTAPRGGPPPGVLSKPDGWRRKDLLRQIREFTTCGDKTFDRLRVAAGIPAAAFDGGGAQRLYGPEDLGAIIKSAKGEEPSFRKGAQIAEALADLLV